MRIKKVEYYDRKLQWQLCPVDFSDRNLVLLVGVSGAGKTQILRAILNLKGIARGQSLNGIKWDITFSTKAGFDYQWQGEFENKELPEELLARVNIDNEINFEIVYERLALGETTIVERDQKGITFNGKLTPKLSPFVSVVEILKLEDDIAPVYEGFKKIIYNDQSAPITNNPALYVSSFDKLMQEQVSLRDIQESDLPINLKLALVYKNAPETFNKIKGHFIDIFPQVEDIRIEPVRIFSNFVFLLQIKEKGVNDWIHQELISSGMLRTIKHLGEMYLSSPQSVILIDEFENSLGINCIDVLTDLLSENRDIQFIITSHHPYIINNIGMEYWKIVTRKGGVVTVKDAKDFKLGRSRHDAFIQLVNLEAFKEGIAS